MWVVQEPSLVLLDMACPPAPLYVFCLGGALILWPINSHFSFCNNSCTLDLTMLSNHICWDHSPQLLAQGSRLKWKVARSKIDDRQCMRRRCEVGHEATKSMPSKESNLLIQDHPVRGSVSRSPWVFGRWGSVHLGFCFESLFKTYYILLRKQAFAGWSPLALGR